MLPELLFFKDLDSFELTPEYLEIVYLEKNFRFNYPLKSNKRKYWVQSFPKSQITISDMLLQTVDTTEVWQDALLVDLSVDFDDVAQLGEMASKLKTMGGYKQVRPNLKITSEDEEFSSGWEEEVSSVEDEEFSSDGDEESDEMDLNIFIGMGPKIMFHDVATHFTVNANYFQLTYNGERHRFLHGNVNPPHLLRGQQLTRQFTTKKGLNSVPIRSSAHMLIPGVMLQKEAPHNVWHDVDVMDVYIEFAGDGCEEACGDLTRALKAQGYANVSSG